MRTAFAICFAIALASCAESDRPVPQETPTTPGTPVQASQEAPPSQDALTGDSMMAGGAAIMPDDLLLLDPSDYSINLARFIPVEAGMDQFAAKDEFLVYYNTEAGPMTRVSMTEKMVNGATIFVIRRTGLADDSVSAEESYALFDAGVLAAYGTRVKCARGDTPDTWVTTLCP